jgi:hypothetical protein
MIHCPPLTVGFEPGPRDLQSQLVLTAGLTLEERNLEEPDFARNLFGRISVWSKPDFGRTGL